MKNSNINQINTTDLNMNKESIDINLKDIFDSIFRRKVYFCSTFLIVLGLGFLKTFDKPTWQGEFQIVIRSKQNSGSGSFDGLNSGGSILSRLNMGGLKNNLQTEVKILESSSMLNPIFNFVREEKKLNNKNIKIKYKNWKDSLSINLIEGTSVLNLKYRDTDKNLIIPVLNKLSDSYQEYSNRDRQSNLNQGINYLREQSKILKKNSQNSLNELMKFNIENNYFSINDLTSLDEIDDSEKSSLTFNFNSSVESSPNGSKLILLSQLEALALEKSSIFKKESEYMTQLNARIENLKGSLSKPTETLIKYRNLRRKAMMDEILSTNIEKQLEYLKLEKAKQKKPWELISVPTLMDDPVAPRKLRIIAVTILSGLFVGTILSLILDKKSKLIYSFSEINGKMPYHFIRKISLKEIDNFQKVLRILINKNININEIVLLPLVDEPFKKEILNKLKLLETNVDNKKVFISNDLEKNNDKTHLIIIKKSNSSSILVEEYLKDLQLLSVSVLGWIYLED